MMIELEIRRDDSSRVQSMIGIDERSDGKVDVRIDLGYAVKKHVLDRKQMKEALKKMFERL